MYRSPTFGELTIDQVFDKTKAYILSDPESEYRIMIGCDSQQHGRSLSVVSAIEYIESAKALSTLLKEQRSLAFILLLSLCKKKSISKHR
jgi:predicted RNase H-related nuclease YkuK (DUF458 family)